MPGQKLQRDLLAKIQQGLQLLLQPLEIEGTRPEPFELTGRETVLRPGGTMLLQYADGFLQVPPPLVQPGQGWRGEGILFHHIREHGLGFVQAAELGQGLADPVTDPPVGCQPSGLLEVLQRTIVLPPCVGRPAGKENDARRGGEEPYESSRLNRR